MEQLPVNLSAKIRINLQEWQSVGPDEMPVLGGFSFKDSLSRIANERLYKAERIELLEFPAGLTIRAKQYVGNIQLENLQISISPKITGLPLLNLLRYAYNLRNLDLFEPLDFGAETGQFQDLLIQQLVVEVNELLQRGLYRKYRRIDEYLQSPKGRINFSTITGRGGLNEASLPCSHSLRIEDNPLNRVLLAGFSFSTLLTNDLILRSHLRQSARILGQSVTQVDLTPQLFIKAKATLDRLTVSYRPALTIIQLLLESHGISIESEDQLVRLPGFLFDMNRFFQALIERFLIENLDGYVVKGEYQLRDMLSYDPIHNPQNKISPTPRPDLAIMTGKKVVALLDTKYRDLWENDLPRDMLYQLALYAFSQDRPGQSTIIYPTLHSEAKESWLDITHPFSGHKLATVKLRPINLYKLEEMINKESASKKRYFAHEVAFGE